MKHASKDYKQPKSLLIAAPPGAGKSTFVAQIPRTFILDTDNNLAGPIEYLRSQGKEPDFFYDSPFTDADGEALPRREWFQRSIALLMEAAASDDVDNLAIDSLSGFTEFVLCEVLKQQGRALGDLELTRKSAKIGDDQMQIQDWGVFFNVMKQLIFRLKNSSKNLIITAHIKSVTDSNNVVRQAIAVPGQVADMISGWFSEVWMLSNSVKRTAKGLETSREVITFPSNKSEQSIGLKSSCGVATGTTMNAEELIAKLKFNAIH